MNQILDHFTKKLGINLNKPSPIDINMSRNALGPLFAELEFTRGAEIGVERGIYSEILCKANPTLTLYCIDPWKAYHGYREHTTQKTIDEIYHEAINRLKPYTCKIIREFSEIAFKEFGDESLDFVCIDGNHDFVHITQDLVNWAPKIRTGGIVAGHDFVRYKGKYGLFNQVKDAVLIYTAENHINPWFVLRDPSERPSWMWVKQ